MAAIWLYDRSLRHYHTMWQQDDKQEDEGCGVRRIKHIWTHGRDAVVAHIPAIMLVIETQLMLQDVQVYVLGGRQTSECPRLQEGDGIEAQVAAQSVKHDMHEEGSNSWLTSDGPLKKVCTGVNRSYLVEAEVSEQS